MTEALHSKSTTALHCYVSALAEGLKIWRGALINTMSFDEITALKFIYSEKTVNFCKISIVGLSYVVTVKFTVKILQNFVANSEYMNFTWQNLEGAFVPLVPSPLCY